MSFKDAVNNFRNNGDDTADIDEIENRERLLFQKAIEEFRNAGKVQRVRSQ